MFKIGDKVKFGEAVGFVMRELEESYLVAFKDAAPNCFSKIDGTFQGLKGYPKLELVANGSIPEIKKEFEAFSYEKSLHKEVDDLFDFLKKKTKAFIDEFNN
jgi:hypothetical protein